MLRKVNNLPKINQLISDDAEIQSLILLFCGPSCWSIAI